MSNSTASGAFPAPEWHVRLQLVHTPSACYHHEGLASVSLHTLLRRHAVFAETWIEMRDGNEYDRRGTPQSGTGQVLRRRRLPGVDPPVGRRRHGTGARGDDAQGVA